MPAFRERVNVMVTMSVLLKMAHLTTLEPLRMNALVRVQVNWVLVFVQVIAIATAARVLVPWVAFAVLLVLLPSNASKPLPKPRLLMKYPLSLMLIMLRCDA